MIYQTFPLMISGKVLKKGLKKVVAASPILGIAVVSAVITKYIIEDLKGKKDGDDDYEIVRIEDPEETDASEDKE